MKYYIADTHFGHHSILSFAKRPFLSTDEMEHVLIHNWNQTVSSKDEVYILGDLFYREEHPERILSQLNGRKILILGNHDARWLSDDLKSYFESIQFSLETTDQNHTLFLCHYPMVSYPKQSRSYMIHGHIHNDTLFDYWHLLLKRKRILNAGVDINHFKPVTLQEMIFNNEQYKQAMLDSYPLKLLSVRLYNKEDESTNAWLKQTLTALSLEEFREGIYLIKEDSDTIRISQLQNEIRNNLCLSQVIKNFDVVDVDKQGQYSYHSYLRPETIYLK